MRWNSCGKNFYIISDLSLGRRRTGQVLQHCVDLSLPQLNLDEDCCQGRLRRGQRRLVLRAARGVARVCDRDARRQVLDRLVRSDRVQLILRRVRDEENHRGCKR